MGWFDVHAHLTHPKLASRQAEVLEHARSAGVTSILSNGLNPHDNEAVQRLAAEVPDGLVKPCFGLYPVDAVLDRMEEMGVDYPRDAPFFRPEEGVAWVREHVDEAFAVGEIGLDGHWVPEALWDAQEAIFRELVQIAMDADKAIIIHTRKREARAFEVLREMGARRVNWHCYTSKVKRAKRIAEEGHYLSIPANARRQQGFTRMLEVLPKEQVLLETDCPYQGPEPGVDNEPANVTHTAAYAAELWGCSIDEVRARMERNFEALFGVAP